MKRLLLPAAVCFFAAAPIQSTFAAEACPSGSGVTATCITHMAELTSDGDKLTQCIRELKSEYFGVNGVAGKGPKYRKKRKECITIATLALDAIESAYVPGGDTSPRDALEEVVDEWKAAADKDE